MKTMKKILFLATAVTVMASCTNDTFLSEGNEYQLSGESTAISFVSASSGITRADHVGAEAADLLNKHFTVGGFKGAGDVTATVTTTGTVFDNYLVNWTENTAATTESNTSDWEYVGTTAAAPSKLVGNQQSIKYWDYSAAQYDFMAYSTGTSTAVTTAPTAGQVQVTAFDPATAKTAAYTLKGADADLKNCYISDMVTVYKSSGNYGKEVKLTFRNLASKVRVAIYETVPGYSVKDVKFYTNNTTSIATGTSVTSATLFTTGSSDKDNFYTGGTYTVKFPTIGSSNVGNSDYNKAHVSFVADTKGTTKDFGTLNLVGREYKEADATNYIGRTSTAASFAGTASPDNYYTTVLPNEEGTVLELRIDYTLLSIDGSGEEIKVHGATAYVPAIYAAWKPNYAYTYIFKISDNTNGWTSTVDSDPVGLYPITFDAVVVDSEEHTQSTITTVATPSITTYQKGHDITKDEYAAGDIYVQVIAAGTLKNDLGTNGQLYTLNRAATEAEVMDALNIQAASDATSITGRNGLVLTEATSVATITAVPGADGNDVTVTAGTAAKFAATTGNYAYVYDTGTDNADTEYNTAVKLTAVPTGWPTGYYTNEACTVAAPSTYADGTYYQKYTNLNKVYGVKVIKVQ